MAEEQEVLTKKAGKGSKKSAKKQQPKKKRSGAFPASSFEEALTIPLAIQKYAAGQKVRRLTLFDHMGKSPESGPSRQLVTNASKYGLIKGSSKSEHLELTPEGNLATSNEAHPNDKVRAQFLLAIDRIGPFKFLYENQRGHRLPASSVLEDSLRESDVDPSDVKECVEKFIVNAKFVGILKSVAGAERILPIEQILEELPSRSVAIADNTSLPIMSTLSNGEPSVGSEEWDKICFYISPIGEDGTERRDHADLFLGSIVEPAVEEFKLKVVRADQIGKPGMIGRQVIEYILNSKLVIVDLSYHNPNVFYELSLRHVRRLPTVQIIRKSDDIPFDLDQFRTIQIDTSTIYTLVPNLQSYKAEIATQVRAALKDPDSVDNPLSTYYPNLKIEF